MECNTVSLINTKPDKVNLRLKKLSADDGRDIYDMLQTMPKDENGLVNKANGLSYEEFKTWLAAKQKESEQTCLVDGWKVPQELLRLLLIEAKKIGLEKVLITIHSDNIASQKVALANGGVITEKTEERVYIWI